MPSCVAQLDMLHRPTSLYLEHLQAMTNLAGSSHACALLSPSHMTWEHYTAAIQPASRVVPTQCQQSHMCSTLHRQQRLHATPGSP
jgi:hypothetical protein